MTNNADRNSPTNDPEPESGSQSPASAPPAAPAQNKIRSDSNNRTDNQSDTARELAREFRWVEFAQLIVNGALAIIGIFALCIYYDQLTVMRGQLGEIIKQYPQLQKSADAAHDAATVASQTLESSSKQFKIEERPYLTIENVRFDPSLEQSHIPATVKFEFHNAGKTPALKATFSLNTYIDGQKSSQLPEDFPAEMTIASDRNNANSISIWMTGAGDFEGIVNGTRKLAIRGTITYTDIFKEWHPTTFCTVYDSKVWKAWVFCPGNDVK